MRYSAAMRYLAVIFALAGVCSPASAQDSDKATEALSNMQMECTVCLAYFNFIKSCAPKDMEADLAVKIDPAIKFMTDAAFAYAQQIGMGNDVAMARLRMAVEDQKQTISKSCMNLSLLYEQHGQRCKRLVESSTEILLEYLGKAH